jgi:hypothetical protein
MRSLHLPLAAIVIVIGCKSAEEKAVSAWLKTVTEQVEKVRDLLKENGLESESETYYKEWMKEDLDRLKAGPDKAQMKKDLKGMKEFMKAFGAGSKEIQKEQKAYLPNWRREKQDRIIENHKRYANQRDNESGRTKSKRDANYAIVMIKNFPHSPSSPEWIKAIKEWEEWKPKDKTQAAHAKVCDYIRDVVIPAIEIKRK